MIQLPPILDTVTGKYFQARMRNFQVHTDKEMTLSVEVLYLDTDQQTTMSDAIEAMNIPEIAKDRLREQFKTFVLPQKTTRGQWIDTATGENVYPDSQTGEFDPDITKITELEYWQNIPNGVGGTKVSEDMYALIYQSMKQIVEKNLGVTVP